MQDRDERQGMYILYKFIGLLHIPPSKEAAVGCLKCTSIIIFFIGALISKYYIYIYIYIASVSIWKWDSEHPEIFITLLVCGILSVITSVIGVCAAVQTSSEIKLARMKQNPVKGGTELLLVFAMLSSLLALAFLVLGTYCIFFVEKAKAQLAAEFANEELWDEIFHGARLEDVQKRLATILMTVGIVSYVISLLFLLATNFALKSMLSTDTFQIFNEVFCLLVLLIGLLLIYVSTYSQIYQQFMDDEDFVWMGKLHAFFTIVGLFIIFMSYLGYLVSYSQSKVGLILYAFLITIFSVLVFGGGIMLIKNIGVFGDELTENCPQVLPLVGEGDLGKIGCPTKYTQRESTASALTCPKMQQMFVWEDNLNITTFDDDAFGCLNMECCGSVVSNFKTRLEYLGIFAMIVGLVTFLSGFFSFILSKSKSLQRRGRLCALSEWWHLHLFIFLAMVVSTCVLAYLCKNSIPGWFDKPKFMQLKETEYPFYQPSQLTSQDPTLKAFSLDIDTSNSELCQKGAKACAKMSFYVEIKLPKGQIRVDQEIKGLVVSNLEKKHVLRLKGNLVNVNKGLQNLKIEPDCPLTPLNVGFLIKVRDEAPGEDNWNEFSSPDEITGFIPVGEKNVVMHFINPSQSQTLTAQFMFLNPDGKKMPVFNKGVEITSKRFPECTFAKSTTDENGIFYAIYPKLASGQSYDLLLNLHSNFGDKEIAAKIGGLPKTRRTDLGLIIIEKAIDNTRNIYYIYIYIYVCVDKMNLDGKVVGFKLKKGLVPVKNALVTLYQNDKEDDDFQDKKETSSAFSGVFEFPALDGIFQYNVSISKEAFYPVNAGNIYIYIYI